MTTQLITPNPNVPCTPGYCLMYVQSTFGIGAKYPSAITAYNASTTKHQDQNWPALWFPIWFTVNGNPYGHVALHAPDHSIYSSSSPTANTPVHHPSLAAMQSYWGKGTMLNYLGWTEDVEDTRVIGGDDQMIIQDADNWFARCNKTMLMIRGRACSRDEFEKYAVGAEFLHWVESVEDNPEADANVDYAKWGRTAKNDHWDQQIADLKQELDNETAKDTVDLKKVDDLTAQLADVQAELKAAQQKPAPVVPAPAPASKPAVTAPITPVVHATPTPAQENKVLVLIAALKALCRKILGRG